ncbi:hypothetical protein [Campylobacter rectus]|uniref:Putative membrane protein n=1 Tax=Campylobacter rectus TaxID=203 RepID=A0A6G5QM59_CAMRE|nr:hypothetical protein [Campylobacter rectus]QCD46795.1 putative membrane protein [Campylobacter rectus]UEB47500.1 hypothetical protein LK437_10965 [Campylobacter rectus]
MLAFILIVIISFAWAIVINQIYLSNLNKSLKFISILSCVIISTALLMFPMFIMPIFLSIFHRKNIKFDKEFTPWVVLFLAIVNFDDARFFITYQYKCNIQKDNGIVALDTNYTKHDVEKFRILSSNEKLPNKISRYHKYNILDNKDNLVAKAYEIYIPYGMVFNEIHKAIMGKNGGKSCGFDGEKGDIEIKQILKNKLK